MSNWTATTTSNATPEQLLEVLTHPERIQDWAPVDFDVADWRRLSAGTRTRVTGLAAQTGPPGLEFLEYELPTAGRPFPVDSHPTDLWHWQTTLVVSDVDAAAAQVHGMGQLISSGVVALPDKSLGFTKSLLIRDSDGHAMQMVSP